MLNDLKYGDEIISIIKARRLVLFAEKPGKGVSPNKVWKRRPMEGWALS